MRTHTTESQRAAVAQNAQAVDSNVVGYQLIKVVNGFSFFTVTFKNVSTETIDLLDIKCTQADGTDWLTASRTASKVCNGEIKVQKMLTTGYFGDTYSYYSGQNDAKTAVIGWAKSGKVSIARGEVTLKPGEGLVVQNIKTGGVEGGFQVSGEVSLGTQYDIANGFSFSGNCTPKTIDLLDIQCKQSDGNDWLTASRTASKVCNGEIKVQKMLTTGYFADTYSYYSGQNDAKTAVIGWAKSGKVSLTRGEVTLEPGEGLIVQNIKTGGVTGLFVFPNPISE